MRAARKRMARERRERLALAHDIGTFVGFATPPPWSDIVRALGEAADDGDMSDEEIMRSMDLHVAGMRAASFGD